MADNLTTDEYEAMKQIGAKHKGERPSACVARNTKRLCGLKYAAHGKDGRLSLTEKGQQTLFFKRCIDGLRALSDHPSLMPEPDVAAFLSKKGHIAAAPSPGGFELTQRGRESLTDIDSAGN